MATPELPQSLMRDLLVPSEFLRCLSAGFVLRGGREEYSIASETNFSFGQKLYYFSFSKQIKKARRRKKKCSPVVSLEGQPHISGGANKAEASVTCPHKTIKGFQQTS